jgi:hypothetical protein
MAQFVLILAQMAFSTLLNLHAHLVTANAELALVLQ